MNSTNSIEDRLSLALGRMGDQYARAIQLIEPLAHDPSATSDRDRCLVGMQDAMDAIRRLEREVQPLRSAWAELDRPAGRRLREVLSEQQRLLGTLIDRVNACERRLSDERSRMLPSVDIEVRRREMQRAYDRAR